MKLILIIQVYQHGQTGLFHQLLQNYIQPLNQIKKKN